jgi:two-component system cell cycle sensor histidine kinase/response regulator CckA
MDAADAAMFLQGPVVVFRWRNADGWPVQLVTPNVEDVLGHTADAFLSGQMRYADLVHPDDLERVVREVETATLANKVRFSHDPYRVLRSDGRTVWLLDYTTIERDDRGEVKSYVGYVIDASDRIHAEAENRALLQQLLHAQKLESLGVLAGGIAHDFNNLLGGILGNAEILRLRTPDRPDLHTNADQIVRTALRASDLCRQLLAYAGGGRSLATEVPLGPLLADLAAVVEASVLGRGQLTTNLDPDLPPVHGDPGQMQQVFLNLLTNAAEALPGRRGSVTVTGGRDGDTVWVAVTDDGLGMTADTVHRIFDPFFTTKAPGRGLGLSAVVGIVKAHRGDVQVQSAPGNGTIVTVRLPVGVLGEARVPAEERSPLELPHRVLVVDDEPAMRDMLTELLATMNVDADAVGDGATALTRLESAAFDAMILDLTMPGMSGTDVLDGMARRGVRVPVIVSSGYAASDMEKILRDRAVAGVLHKPFLASALRAQLANVAERWSHPTVGAAGPPPRG